MTGNTLRNLGGDSDRPRHLCLTRGSCPFRYQLSLAWNGPPPDSHQQRISAVAAPSPQAGDRCPPLHHPTSRPPRSSRPASPSSATTRVVALGVLAAAPVDRRPGGRRRRPARRLASSSAARGRVRPLRGVPLRLAQAVDRQGRRDGGPRRRRAGRDGDGRPQGRQERHEALDDRRAQPLDRAPATTPRRSARSRPPGKRPGHRPRRPATASRSWSTGKSRWVTAGYLSEEKPVALGVGAGPLDGAVPRLRRERADLRRRLRLPLGVPRLPADHVVRRRGTTTASTPRAARSTS